VASFAVHEGTEYESGGSWVVVKAVAVHEGTEYESGGSWVVVKASVTDKL
jgi:hypothetical protein